MDEALLYLVFSFVGLIVVLFIAKTVFRIDTIVYELQRLNKYLRDRDMRR